MCMYVCMYVCMRLSITLAKSNIKLTLIFSTFKALETSNAKSHVY